MSSMKTPALLALAAVRRLLGRLGLEGFYILWPEVIAAAALQQRVTWSLVFDRLNHAALDQAAQRAAANAQRFAHVYCAHVFLLGHAPIICQCAYVPMRLYG